MFIYLLIVTGLTAIDTREMPKFSPNVILNTNTLLEKSQQLCQQIAYRIAYGTPKRRYVIASFFRPYHACVWKAWKKCRHASSILSQVTPRNETSSSPCLLTTFNNYHDKRSVFSIVTYPHFQINLTFIYFNLRLQYKGCSQHVTVCITLILYCLSV